MRYPQSKTWWPVALVALAIACKSDSLEPGGGSVASVVVAPQRATVAVGASVPITAEVLDASGRTLPGRKIAWASGDPAIATVSGDGVVTGVKVGTVQIAASAEGKSAIAEVTVMPFRAGALALDHPRPPVARGAARDVEQGVEPPHRVELGYPARERDQRLRVDPQAARA